MKIFNKNRYNEDNFFENDNKALHDFHCIYIIPCVITAFYLLVNTDQNMHNKIYIAIPLCFWLSEYSVAIGE